MILIINYYLLIHVCVKVIDKKRGHGYDKNILLPSRLTLPSLGQGCLSSHFFLH